MGYLLYYYLLHYLSSYVYRKWRNRIHTYIISIHYLWSYILYMHQCIYNLMNYSNIYNFRISINVFIKLLACLFNICITWLCNYLFIFINICVYLFIVILVKMEWYPNSHIIYVVSINACWIELYKYIFKIFTDFRDILILVLILLLFFSIIPLSINIYIFTFFL